MEQKYLLDTYITENYSIFCGNIDNILVVYRAAHLQLSYGITGPLQPHNPGVVRGS